MQKNEISSIVVKSDSNLPIKRRPFIIHQEKKISIISNPFNNSNDSVINNSKKDISDDDDDDVNDVDEENIFEKTIGAKAFQTPLNDSHRLFLSQNRFVKTLINSIPLKRILVPKSKSPNIRNYGRISNRNEFMHPYAFVKKNLTTKNNVFNLNDDFLHCRNCMMVVAYNRYGKYYFNK